MRFPTRAHVLGTGMTKLGKLGRTSFDLTKEAFESALADAGVTAKSVDGVIAVPSLSDPRFMHGHFFATKVGLLGKGNPIVCRTIDTGGASPVTSLLEADRMIRSLGCDCVAIVGGDAVASMPTADFLESADFGCRDPDDPAPSPVIPTSYDRVAQWQMKRFGVTREQLAMVSVLMSMNASRHPLAMTRKPHTLEQVLTARPIGPATTLLETARRADGGAALIVASSRFIKEHGLQRKRAPVVVSGGEASGPLFPPKVIDEDMFSCEQAAKTAYEAAQLGPKDIDFWGLYDCFPVCLLRAIEAVGLAPRGCGGAFVEEKFRFLSEAAAQGRAVSPDDFPINTHGGLLAFGAPWELPAIYNIIEAVDQLRGTAGARQLSRVRRALVYGNGGVFSSSAVCILGSGDYV